jgi:putative transposase
MYLYESYVMFREQYRETFRLEGFDYGSDGAYFVTICSHNREKIFSNIINGKTHMSALGKIILEELERTAALRTHATVTEWVIMPDHVHCIIFIHKNSNSPEHLSRRGSYLHFPEGYKNKFGPQSENLASIVRGIKSAVTQRAKIAGMAYPVWQSRFHEHIIRNEIELAKYILYVKNNPVKWKNQTEILLL